MKNGIVKQITQTKFATSLGNEVDSAPEWLRDELEYIHHNQNDMYFDNDGGHAFLQYVEVYPEKTIELLQTYIELLKLEEQQQ